MYLRRVYDKAARAEPYAFRVFDMSFFFFHNRHAMSNLGLKKLITLAPFPFFFFVAVVVVVPDADVTSLGKEF